MKRLVAGAVVLVVLARWSAGRLFLPPDLERKR